MFFGNININIVIHKYDLIFYFASIISRWWWCWMIWRIVDMMTLAEKCCAKLCVSIDYRLHNEKQIITRVESGTISENCLKFITRCCGDCVCHATTPEFETPKHSASCNMEQREYSFYYNQHELQTPPQAIYKLKISHIPDHRHVKSSFVEFKKFQQYSYVSVRTFKWLS